jgi:hypothetical protein
MFCDVTQCELSSISLKLHILLILKNEIIFTLEERKEGGREVGK